MSDIVEKTLASLPRFLSDGLLGTKSQQTPKSTSTRAFQNFMRLVNGVKSRHEEEQIVRREISVLKQKLSQPDITPAQMCDYLCRVLYCDMIGYDVTFSFIHAVKFAQKGTALEKRIGYLACSLLLNENHELILLLVNTIQKDLKSSNLLDNCMALTAVCQLLNTEMIPMVLPLVEEKLTHPRELVRMKAVMCLHKFLLKAPSLMHNMEGKLHKSLCDKDPGVMSVSVHLYYQLIKENPEQYESVGESLIHIFNQIINRRLPATFEYHSIPLPWLQIELLQCLALLGSKSQRISELFYPLLRDVLARTNIKDNIAFAIIYESIHSITMIQPNKELLEEASRHVGRFLRSTSRHLQYIGIKALTALVKRGAEYVLDYQMTVVECLDCSDKSTQRKTLELLSCMANDANVAVVCDKLLEHLSKSSDPYWKSDLVVQVADLADRYPLLFSTSRREWYVDTIFDLLMRSRGCSPTGVVDKIIKVIGSECQGEDNCEEFCHYVTAKCLETLHQTDLTPDLLHIIIWVLGEYANFLNHLPQDKLLKPLLGYFVNSEFTEEVRVWILSAMRKLFCAGVLERDELVSCLNGIGTKELQTYTRHRLKELIHFVRSGIRLDNRTRLNNSSLQFDGTLSFLDDFVSEALEGGASPYKSSQLRYMELNSLHKSQERDVLSGVELKTYSQVSDRSSASTHGSAGRPGSSEGGGHTQNAKASGLDMTGVKRVWSKHGVATKEEHVSQHKLLSPVSRQLTGENDDDAANKDGQDEEQTRKHNLASALFQGITNQQNQKSEQMENKTEHAEHQNILRVSGTTYSKPIISTIEADPLPRADTGGWRELHKISNQNLAKALAANESFAFLENTSSEAVSTNEVTVQQLTEDRVLFKQNLSTEECIPNKNDSVKVLPNDLLGGQSPVAIVKDDDQHSDPDQRTSSQKLDPNERSMYDNYMEEDSHTSDVPTNPDSHESLGGTSLYDEFYSNGENL
ncbi:hypothetical protein ScPMuIL_002444 [Solemya velum]